MNIRKGTPVFNHLICDVQALKTTRPTILLESLGPLLGHKGMPLELSLQRADQSNGAQVFSSPNCETVQPDTTFHTTNKPMQPHSVITIGHESVATAPSHVIRC